MLCDILLLSTYITHSIQMSFLAALSSPTVLPHGHVSSCCLRVSDCHPPLLGEGEWRVYDPDNPEARLVWRGSKVVGEPDDYQPDEEAGEGFRSI